MDQPHLCLETFDPDAAPQTMLALGVSVKDQKFELPMHLHRKGQLVVALRGGVMCRAQGGLWMVPPGGGVWIPGGVAHSNRVTINGQICLLFIDPVHVGLPEHCCTLSLTPLIVEIVKRLADFTHQDAARDAHADRIAAVLLEELRRAEVSALHLPIPDDPTLTRIANALIQSPDDRSTVGQWAARMAMSERTLARLVSSRTAMSFGRWRQQLHIIMALQKLSSGMSVQNVSDSLGYGSVSAFITMFRSVLGQPPARYIAGRGGASL
ncbi:AraC family transcriptional regulator [Camelimonas fluminis]|uniref:AraC family transcriptional regulator n=1 Tax=Camelimonas fluminis TaxID=1576911 RepID=A0ABV7UF29_9HYPH|nr:helix-turn-helix transcriptional regulator [Camelimonas fluminis]GHE66312.1 AraC family transcriptional regulator [Camelimonas fluminis]